MGKAIVASDLDQIGAILSSGKNALLFTPGDSKDLADKLLALANDSTLRLQLGMNARAHVIEKYTWDRHVQMILDKVDSL